MGLLEEEILLMLLVEIGDVLLVFIEVLGNGIVICAAVIIEFFEISCFLTQCEIFIHSFDSVHSHNSGGVFSQIGEFLV
jgi:hypothetical protein